MYSVTVLEECDANQALKEIYRVVKPGGSIGAVVRAIDMPQWLDFSVDDELWRKIIIPPQLISPSGVADKSLTAEWPMLILKSSDVSLFVLRNQKS